MFNYGKKKKQTLDNNKLYSLKGDMFNPNKIINTDNWNNRLQNRINKYCYDSSSNVCFKK